MFDIYSITIYMKEMFSIFHTRVFLNLYHYFLIQAAVAKK